MSNIISFPKEHKLHPPQNEDELKEHAKRVQFNFAQKHCTDFAFEVFRMIEGNGFNLSGPNCNTSLQSDMVLISEAIKSCLLRTMNQEHPLQEFAENVINLQESDIVFTEEIDEDST